MHLQGLQLHKLLPLPDLLLYSLHPLLGIPLHLQLPGLLLLYRLLPLLGLHVPRPLQPLQAMEGSVHLHLPLALVLLYAQQSPQTLQRG